MMTNVLAGYDLDRVDGRLAAVREAAGLLSSIRDGSLVAGYLRELASMIGMDIEDVRRELKNVSRSTRVVATTAGNPPTKPQDDGLPWPDPDDRALEVERGTLKLMLQFPTLFDTAWNGVIATDFRHPGYRQVFSTLSAISYGSGWLAAVNQAAQSDIERQLMVSLTVEPLWREPDENYALAYTTRLQLVRVAGEISELKSKLQRTNPITAEAEYRTMFEQLLTLEKHRKELQLLSLGEEL
ncbi:MAG: hypothetical protein CR979_01915 [Propionibacterium sp.]|nr:MAG: hypothetical protein CR979_01915 [Propionibacterium sp.]